MNRRYFHFQAMDIMRVFLTLIGLFWGGALVVRAGATHYVAHSGQTPTPDYESWNAAASNIQDAIDKAVAPDTVMVSNGTYNLTSQISIAQNITVKSLNGINFTFVNGNYSARCFYMSSGVLDGFTISNGFVTSDGGGGVYFTSGGTLNNCTITGNTASNNHGGGAFCQSGGTLNNCTITGNTVLGAGTLSGAGVYFESGGMASNCTLANNNSSYRGGGAGFDVGGTMNNCLVKGNTAYNGGGVWFNSGGTLNNCLLMGNSGSDYSFGAYMNAGGTLNNCTVVSNQGGVALMAANATVNNCIVWGATNGWNMWRWAGTTVRYTCSDPVQSGDGNIGTDPLFVNTNTGNYRLTANSLCVNTGSNQSWMTGATDLDGRRRQDFFSGHVDMGCYEYIPKGTLFRIP